jgi:putative transcriptional regulator
MAKLILLFQFLLLSLLGYIHVTGFRQFHSNVRRDLRVFSSIARVAYTRIIPKTVRKVPYTGEGCVLLSQPGEYDHYLIKSAVLVFDCHPQRGTLGVILDKPSGFGITDLATGMEVFKGNAIFTGGNGRQDTVVMIHAHPLESGLCRSIGKGLYVGGLGKAKELIKHSEADARDFKFFFNAMEWGPGELEKQIKEGRWDVCEVPPVQLINQDPFETRPHYLWHQLRQALQLDE